MFIGADDLNQELIEAGARRYCQELGAGGLVSYEADSEVQPPTTPMDIIYWCGEEGQHCGGEGTESLAGDIGWNIIGVGAPQQPITQIVCESNPTPGGCDCPEPTFLLNEAHPCYLNSNHCDEYTFEQCPSECRSVNELGEPFIFSFFIRFNEIETPETFRYIFRPANAVDDYALTSDEILTGFSAQNFPERIFSPEEISKN